MKKLTFLLYLILSLNMLHAQMPKPQYATLAGTKLCYYEQGKGQPILLLHGWPQTSYVWRKVIPELSKKYRVIALDLPGMGNSGTTDKYDTQSVAAVINSFVTQLNLSPLHLTGHDVGAWVAAAYALQYPKTLKTLCLIDAGIPGLINPAIFQPENAAKVWQFYFHAVSDIPEFLIEGKEKQYLNWYFSNKSFIKTAINDQDLNIYTDSYLGKERLKNGFAYYRSFAESVKQHQNINTTLDIPVLAVGGDHALGTSVGEAAKKIAQHVTSVSLKDCGHYVPEEQPEQLAKLIDQLITGNK